MKIFFLLLYLFFPLLLDSNNLNSNRHDQKIFAELNEENNLICANFIIINVNGLVCDFCAQSLEKTFGKMKQIKNVVIDLINGNVKLTLNKKNDLNDNIINQTFLDSGYDVTKIERKCNDR